MKRLLLVLACCLFGSGALAVQPDEMLQDPKLEARARALSQELRCMVCQNQSIDDSDAPLARDLRLIVRERLAAGDSDRSVIDYLVSRYGEFVLLRPRWASETLLLWLLPAFTLLGGIFLLARIFRAAPASGTQPLTRDEAQRIENLLKDRDT